MRSTQFPQPALKILFYAFFDGDGMVVFASGVMWLTQEQWSFFHNLPRSMAGAIGAVIAWFVPMLRAAVQPNHELLELPVVNTRCGV
jgi:hypothetical protein